ncbi:MAG: lipopolysaccharide biosynthesis protein, partial [Muribaculum sp.]|nr:lipopolysaccharide biosynthesis protein [Muribaculum sp.]
MGVTFYTFRMVLELLGVEDYGTYNVIGGVIVLFSFISGALTQSTQRYLSFHIGKNDMESLKQIFSMSINIYILASVLILTLAETIGLWFINSYMNFPTDDLYVVNIVYQFTIVSLIFQLLQLPYQSAIIAFERMNFFAYLSILEAALKLAVVLILFNLESNRLIGYAISLSGVSIAICLSYRFYCTRKFDSCKYIRIWNK